MAHRETSIEDVTLISWMTLEAVKVSAVTSALSQRGDAKFRLKKAGKLPAV